VRDEAVWVTSRVLPVLLLNLLPLVLVVQGHLETADLLLAYLLSSGIGLAGLAARARRPASRFRALDWQLRAAAVVMPLALWTAAAVRVVSHVEWTAARAVTALLTGVVLAAGTTWALRDRGAGRPGGRTVGRVVWELFVLTIGVFPGLAAAEAYPVLRENGWTFGQVGDAWSFPFGTLFARFSDRTGLDPDLFPAVMVLCLVTVNETLLTLRRELAPRTVDETEIELPEISPGRS
jgi:hypothetical protein